jgi:hypothetical protein
VANIPKKEIIKKEREKVKKIENKIKKEGIKK